MFLIIFSLTVKIFKIPLKFYDVVKLQVSVKIIWHVTKNKIIYIYIYICICICIHIYAYVYIYVVFNMRLVIIKNILSKKFIAILSKP